MPALSDFHGQESLKHVGRILCFILVLFCLVRAFLLMVPILFIDAYNQSSRKGDYPFESTLIDSCLHPLI